MNRRTLLKLLSAGAIGATFDIERALWIPGAKTIFIPPENLTLHTEFIGLPDDAYVQAFLNGISVDFNRIGDENGEDQATQGVPPKSTVLAL